MQVDNYKPDLKTTLQGLNRSARWLARECGVSPTTAVKWIHHGGITEENRETLERVLRAEQARARKKRRMLNSNEGGYEASRLMDDQIPKAEMFAVLELVFNLLPTEERLEVWREIIKRVERRQDRIDRRQDRKDGNSEKPSG